MLIRNADTGVPVIKRANLSTSYKIQVQHISNVLLCRTLDTNTNLITSHCSSRTNLSVLTMSLVSVLTKIFIFFCLQIFHVRLVIKSNKKISQLQLHFDFLVIVSYSEVTCVNRYHTHTLLCLTLSQGSNNKLHLYQTDIKKTAALMQITLEIWIQKQYKP